MATERKTTSQAGVYVVKTQGGAGGFKRETVKGAFAFAVAQAPARVYRVGKPNVLLGWTEKNGRLRFTPEGEQAALAEAIR